MSICDWGRVLFVLAAMRVGVAQPAPAASFLPLVPNSATVIRTTDGSVSLGFVVESARSFGDTAIGRVRVENPWLEHSWLIFEDSRGTWLSGFRMQSVDYHFAEPSPLFMKGGYPGQKWKGEMTEVLQTGSRIWLDTREGVIRDASRFRITFSDGSVQEWTVAAGRGVVAAGPSSADLVLAEAQQGEPVNPWSVERTDDQFPGCSRAGVSAIPMDASLTLAQRRQALRPASDMGARLNVSTISWDELEPNPTQIKTRRVADEVGLASASGMTTALIIRTIDSTVAHRPHDLRGLPWDHPAVVSRFATAAKTLLAALSSQPKWIHIAYEVEPYLNAKPEEIAPFKRFAAAVTAELKTVSSASVGIVFGFDATKTSGRVFQQLESVCEHIAFDYYALRPQNGFSHRSAESPAYDVPLMLSFAGNRRVVLTEAGYSSSNDVQGSREKQSRFFSLLFQKVAASKGQIAAVNVWSMNDMPANVVQQVVNSYMLNVPGAAGFLSSLGIRNSKGQPKPAYAALQEAFSSLHDQLGCVN